MLPIVAPNGLDKLKEDNIKIQKLIILDEEKRLIELRPELTSFLGSSASITKAVPGMLEILPPGSSKGDGVQRLLAHFGIAPEETIAFGDGENDIEMLEHVGVGVAVANAKDSLKRVALYITLSNEECGVAAVLEQLPSLPPSLP